MRGNVAVMLFSLSLLSPSAPLAEVVFKFFDIMTEQELSADKLSFAIGARF
jgi:hypothetical protein